MFIDLNSDLGEGGPSDADIVPAISSANVACCFHAGDPETAFRTLELAVQHGVVVGAHPGYGDREHFGRIELAKSKTEIFRECLFQISGLMALAEQAKTKIRYLKPHGALYNQACRERGFADALVDVAIHFGLPLVGLPESQLERVAWDRSLPFFAEGFADRRYLPDGTLVPRNQPNAHIENPQEAVEQVRRLIADRGVQTICIHGDGPNAVLFANALRRELTSAGFQIRPFV